MQMFASGVRGCATRDVSCKAEQGVQTQRCRGVFAHVSKFPAPLILRPPRVQKISENWPKVRRLARFTTSGPAYRLHSVSLRIS